MAATTPDDPSHVRVYGRNAPEPAKYTIPQGLLAPPAFARGARPARSVGTDARAFHGVGRQATGSKGVVRQPLAAVDRDDPGTALPAIHLDGWSASRATLSACRGPVGWARAGARLARGGCLRRAGGSHRPRAGVGASTGSRPHTPSSRARARRWERTGPPDRRGRSSRPARSTPAIRPRCRAALRPRSAGGRRTPPPARSPGPLRAAPAPPPCPPPARDPR